MNQEMTELINAIKANNIDRVKELLPKVKKNDLNDYHSIEIPGAHDFEFISAAVAALYTPNAEMVKLLLKSGADFKKLDPSLKSPTAYEIAKIYPLISQILDDHYAHQEDNVQNLTGDKTEIS